MLMFVCPTVSELRFYGCCHPCYIPLTQLWILLFNFDWLLPCKQYSNFSTNNFNLQKGVILVGYTNFKSVVLSLKIRAKNIEISKCRKEDQKNNKDL